MQFVCKRVTVMYIPSNYLHLHVHNMYIVFYRGVLLKNSNSYNSCQYSFVIASVGFTIDRVTTQHTPTCVESCFDHKVSYNCLSNSYQIFCNLGYNSKNSVFISTVHGLFCFESMFVMCTDQNFDRHRMFLLN